MSSFGLAFPKIEGQMVVDYTYGKDVIYLPPLPPSAVCSSVNLAGRNLTRKEYCFELIKSQKYF